MAAPTISRPSGHDVQHGRVLGESDRVVEGGDQNVGAEQHARGAGGEAGEHRDRRRPVVVDDGVVLLHPDGVEAEILSADHFLEGFLVVLPAFDGDEADLEPGHDHPFPGERPGGAPGPGESTSDSRRGRRRWPTDQYTPARKGPRAGGPQWVGMPVTCSRRTRSCSTRRPASRGRGRRTPWRERSARPSPLSSSGPVSCPARPSSTGDRRNRPTASW